ncbi:MAG: hypothetical protein AB7O65_15035 [Candidatus Korobacteraceae bacterium]
MLTNCAFVARIFYRSVTACLAAALALAASPLNAQDFDPKITIGGGVRTSFVHTEPDAGDSTDQFKLDNIRLYLSGGVTEKIKFMFNTEYDGVGNNVDILDAVGRLEMAPQFNIWFGRFLPPSDRANLYGPYYARHWAVYTDGVQNGHPFIFQGRDNGVAYWGDFNKIKLSVGAFDGATATGRNDVIGAARIQINFWDKEEGYYLNSTYYGAKNLLSLGGATQVQDGRTASTVDLLMERKLPNNGVITLESEYSNYNRLGGYDGNYAKSQGGYGLAAYLFPKQVGMGKFEVLGKYAIAQFTHGVTPSYRQKTTEINFNYIIKEFNARVMTFYKDTRFNAIRSNFWQAGVGLQFQI